MKESKQLDRIEQSLTPRQAFLLWMQENHKFRCFLEYAHWLKDQPLSVYPLVHLPEQVEASTRKAMKGQADWAVGKAVREAVRDVAFLFHLHEKVNEFAMTNLEEWRLRLAAFAGLRLGLMQREWLRDELGYVTWLVDMKLPYPLDPATDAAVDAAIRHHVTSWPQLEDEMDTWLWSYLTEHGVKELPGSSFEHKTGKYRPTVTAENEAEVRARFPDDAGFEKFRAGEDYTHGLAGISDAEYDAHYQRMVGALEELVASKQVQAGSVVWLDTVPIPALQEAPLVEGCWLDRYVLGLAEWGALALEAGYEMHDAGDEHPLACQRFLPADGSEADRDEVAALRQEASRHLARFRGRKKMIDGRPYCSFEDYCRWRGRNIKGDLRAEMETGVVTASWNAWVAGQGGEDAAQLAGIPVEALVCEAENYEHRASVHDAEEQAHRHNLLETIRGVGTKNDPYEDRAERWHDAAEGLLLEMRAFQEAAASISRRYCDGQDVLFPDLVQDLAKIIKDMEGFVDSFDGTFGDGTGTAKTDRSEAVDQDVASAAAWRSTFMVDLAKAEALSFMGEQGMGVELIARYLG